MDDIPLLRPYFDTDEIEELKEVLSSGWVSKGPKVQEFEKCIADFIGVKYAIAVTNCTSALHLSLLSVGIKEGDEVLVGDYTYPATGHSVLYLGAKPVFVDIDPKTYNIDSDKFEEKITGKTKAIIPVHTFGQPAEMDRIMEIAESNDLKVIEDGACALGAKYKGKYAGTIGDTGCYSFHARKGITTGEGGMVVTNNEELANNIRKLSVFGLEGAWEREEKGFYIPRFTELGYNYKMSDITAAVGVAQLRKLDKIISKKRKLAKHWDRELQEIEDIEAPFVSENSFHIYQSYVALLDKKIDRNKLIEKLGENGVQAQIGTYASHIQPVYYSKDECPNSLEIFHRALALPMYYKLTENEIDMIVDNIKKVLGELK